MFKLKSIDELAAGPMKKAKKSLLQRRKRGGDTDVLNVIEEINKTAMMGRPLNIQSRADRRALQNALDNQNGNFEIFIKIF